jgi:hypothetical protein
MNGTKVILRRMTNREKNFLLMHRNHSSRLLLNSLVLIESMIVLEMPYPVEIQTFEPMVDLG